MRPDEKRSLDSLIFFVNGKKVIESEPNPRWTLLNYLRNQLKLCGTKEGCGVGGCGACTVMISRINRDTDKIIHLAVNACITPVCSLHGAAVTTVEGIGSIKTKLHPIQERLAKSHGSQCGFCTPGFVMSMYALMRSKPDLKMEDIEEAFQGNLCRCTGYRPILAGMESFTTQWEQNRISQTLSSSNGVCGLGENCCKNRSNQNGEKNVGSITTQWEQNSEVSSAITSNGVCGIGEKCCKNNRNLENGEHNGESSFKPYDSSQEAIFPPELKLSPELDRQKLTFCKDGIIWLRPTSLKELIDMEFYIPNCKIVSGNTEIGIETKFGNPYPVLVSPVLITELHKIERFPGFISLGGTVSLTELKDFIASELKSFPASEVGVLREIHDMLHWFAGKQVRNVATVAGNIVTSSPISDLSPIFLATKVRLNLLSKQRGWRKVVIDKDFFIDYRKNVIQPDEIVVSFEIPLTERNQFVKAYKQARRREDDISIVTAAFNAFFDGMGRIEDISLAFGGMSKTTVLAERTAKILIGRKWNEDTLNAAINSLIDEFSLDASTPGGMAGYRTALCPSIFMKFYVATAVWLKNILKINTDIDRSFLSAENSFDYKFCGGSQYFEIKTDTKAFSDPIGKPMVHASAFKQTTGEAIYGDDVPPLNGELFAAFVMSKRAHAKILEIDPSEALQQKGAVAFFSYKDINPSNNLFGFYKDEEVFAAGRVRSFADIVGVIVAEDKLIANHAVKQVNVIYEDLPLILTLEDAIERKSFFSTEPVTLKKGDINMGFKDSKFVFEGTCRTSAQEHFYLEPYCAYARPKEDELEVMSSTQHPCELAEIISHTLNIPLNKVILKVKRLGGAFGGKETRINNFTLPIAFAANKLGKPIRCALDRSEDMQLTGNRHPFLIKYRVGCDEEGKIIAVDFVYYCNAGCTMDFSTFVMQKALMNSDNAYYFPNIEARGYICKTNLPSNTAFRGFGAPQAMLAVETMMRDIAHRLGKDYLDIAELNLYKEGDLTHMNQLLENCSLRRCWTECLKQADYERRRKETENFNRDNRWKKKGIAIVPTKFMVSFGVDVLMQGSAYVLIYNDGSVLVNVGGVEMGQGLYTKMIQIASKIFEIDVENIHISEASSDKIPNQGPTAASMGSDIFGMAVMDACTKLKQRLQPYKDNNPEGRFQEWAMAAWLDRVSLAATGHYKARPVTWTMATNKGHFAEYFTFGTAVSEVIIDCLSGDHQVLRTDIVMDLGESLNPAIDIGQIEGAFTQGYGMYLLEETMITPSGRNITNGPSNYKIPAAGDIPREFNVSLLRGCSNPRAVYASRAVGEPPLFLGSSVFFAVKEAISSARKDAGVDPHFFLPAPATCEKIRMACVDGITEKVCLAAL